MNFARPEILQELDTASRDALNALDMGVIEVDDQGTVLFYNTYESQLAGLEPQVVEGRHFFTQVAPCTNNRLFYGRFKDGVARASMDVEIAYTFTYKLRPTNVFVHLYRSSGGRNWVLVKRR